MTADHDTDDAKLDEMIEESFPASDPPGNTVETGIHMGYPAPLPMAVIDNADLLRFEITRDGETAFLAYERSPHVLTLMHTEVPKLFRGQHLGETLVEAALAAARTAGLRIVVVCPFARAYLRRHPPSPPIQ